MISYECHRCGEPMESPDSLTGQEDACPKCGCAVQVPLQPPPLPPSATARTAKPSADSGSSAHDDNSALGDGRGLGVDTNAGPEAAEPHGEGDAMINHKTRRWMASLCPHCGAQLQAPDALVNQAGICSKCGTPSTVPDTPGETPIHLSRLRRRRYGEAALWIGIGAANAFVWMWLSGLGLIEPLPALLGLLGLPIVVWLAHRG